MKLADRSFPTSLAPLAFLLILLFNIVAGAQVTESRSLDGSGNNPLHPTWGSAGSIAPRLGPNSYEDGISTITTLRPNARRVSNVVHAQQASRPDRRGLNELTWVWAQFIDHDLDHVLLGAPTDRADVSIPSGDAVFTPGQILPMTRSQYVGGITSAREQVNNISCFLDAGMVYGGRASEGDGLARANWLRSFSGGQLRTSIENGEHYLPRRGDASAPIMAGAVTDPTRLFVAGDIRANENPGLLSMHTLFVREHNAVASRIAGAAPALNDEQLYQAARKVIGGLVQAITYNEFLPAMGVMLAPYRGYDPTVNPSLANEFVAGAFRTPHSQVNDQTLRLNPDGTVHPTGHIRLESGFFQPELVVESGIGPILHGLGSQVQEAMDASVHDGLRNLLFGPASSGPIANGSDIAALDIQRGRDHGLADYNSTRVALGLPALSSFEEIADDEDLRSSLRAVYGSVDRLDLWTGLVCEDNVPGASLGELNLAIWLDQFARVRDGDRLFFLNDPDFLPGGFLDRVGFGADELSSRRLADVIEEHLHVVVGRADNTFFVVPEPSALGWLTTILPTLLRRKQR